MTIWGLFRTRMDRSNTGSNPSYPWVMPLQAALLISKTSAVDTVFMLLVWICCSSSVGESNIYYEQYLKKTRKNVAYFLMWLCKICSYFYLLFCRWNLVTFLYDTLKKGRFLPVLKLCHISVKNNERGKIDKHSRLKDLSNFFDKLSIVCVCNTFSHFMHTINFIFIFLMANTYWIVSQTFLFTKQRSENFFKINNKTT